MTKAEATAIYESTCRALVSIQGMKFPWAEIEKKTQNVIMECHKTAIDELERIKDMAKSELGE